MLTPLCELARKYGSDKFSAKHSYTAWYWEQFKDRRETVRKVVEIGVGEGASLRMWRDFFPNAMIYGADNDWTRIFDDERIKVVLCDQSRSSDLLHLLNTTGNDIDLFIDDGSHNPLMQTFTHMELMPLLAPGVIYVVEDVVRPDLLAGFSGCEMPELELRKRYDNCLVVDRHAQS